MNNFKIMTIKLIYIHTQFSKFYNIQDKIPKLMSFQVEVSIKHTYSR